MKSVRNAVLLAALAWLASSCARQAPTETVATMEQLMYGMVDPLANVVFEAIQTVVDEEGVHEVQPETEDDWDFVQNTALALADAGTLMKIEGRPLSEGTPERRDDWDAFVDDMAAAAGEAAEAARIRSPEDLFTAGSNLYEVGCLACHQAYMPENAEPF